MCSICFFLRRAGGYGVYLVDVCRHVCLLCFDEELGLWWQVAVKDLFFSSINAVGAGGREQHF